MGGLGYVDTLHEGWPELYLGPMQSRVAAPDVGTYICPARAAC